MDAYLLWLLNSDLRHVVRSLPHYCFYWITPLIVIKERFSMPSPNEIIAVREISTDERVRVFRRTFHGMKEFEGMEVDAYIVITDRYLIVLDTLLCPEDVS